MYSSSPTRQRNRQLFLATGLATVGIASLISAAAWQTFPTPLLLWLGFAAAHVYFEWNAVEVNDRLLASPTIMVLATAAVVFGRASAVLGVTVLASLGLLTPADIRQRRWFQPLANFGSFTLTAMVSSTVLVALLPRAPIADTAMWRVAVAAALAALVYGTLNLLIVSAVVRAVYGRHELRPWSHLGSIALPLLGMGFLGGLLGAAYHLVGPVTLPLIFIVFFVGHMTFASYSRLREAQESTLRGFVKALEAKDLYTRGHTERVAYFSELIGHELGFTGTQLERLRWAALIHDVGKLAVPRELIRKRARLTSEEYGQMQAHVHLVEDLLCEVEFLQPVVDVAANHHAHYDGNGYHGTSDDPGQRPPIEARILAVADSFDAMTSTRSYRVALSQQYAYGELRKHAGTQFDPVAVESLIQVLTRRGETYGSPDVHSEEDARRRAEELALDG